MPHLLPRRHQFARPPDAVCRVAGRRAPGLDHPRWLDLVLVPLVGFDARGHRLGMGAGLYDRHFAFLRQRRAWRRPLLIGLAFEAQKVVRLAEEAHDVQLDGVVTERGVYGRAVARLPGPEGGAGR